MRAPTPSCQPTCDHFDGIVSKLHDIFLLVVVEQHDASALRQLDRTNVYWRKHALEHGRRQGQVLWCGRQRFTKVVQNNKG